MATPKRFAVSAITLFLFLLTSCPQSSGSASSSEPINSSQSETSTSSSETSISSSSSAQLQEYTITFQSNGGSNVTAITADEGTPVLAPTPPTKEGHTFAGWFKEATLDTLFVFTVMPSNNLTLYADWTINSYTITFFSNGGSYVAPIMQAFGTTVPAPSNPDRAGYTFGGWYNEPLTVPYNFSTMPAENISLFAKWSVNEYTMTFITSGGSSITPITQAYNTPVTPPANPTKEGYTFAGWFADELRTIPLIFSTMPAENVSVYAKWTINEYTITFHTLGGSSIATITLEFEALIELPNPPTLDGFSFTGWFIDSQLVTPFTLETMPAYNLVLYAEYARDGQEEPLMSIASFKALPANDTDTHSISGVVFMVIDNEDMPVIVIADETGVTGVISSLAVVRNDLIVASGTRASQDGIIIMIPAETEDAVIVLAEQQAFPLAPQSMSIEDFNLLDDNDINNWFQYIALTGNINIIDGWPVLFSGDETTPIIYFDQGVDLGSLQGLDIEIKGMILPMIDGLEVTLMFVFNGDGSSISPAGSDQETLVLLENMFRQMYETRIYLPGQTIMLPLEHPIIPVVIEYELVGANSNLFNLETMTFNSDIESLSIIDLQVTASLGIVDNYIFVVDLIVDPDVIMSISEFILEEANMENIYFLEGVVVFIQTTDGPDSLYLISDGTGKAYLNSTRSDVQIGDKIIAQGYRFDLSDESPFPALMYEGSQTIISVVSSDNPMPDVPQAYSVSEFLNLDPETPNLLFSYISVAGTLVTNDNNFILLDGDSMVFVFVLEPTGLATLAQFVDQEVVVKGLIFIADIAGQKTVLLAFINYPGDIVAVAS